MCIGVCVCVCRYRCGGVCIGVCVQVCVRERVLGGAALGEVGIKDRRCHSNHHHDDGHPGPPATL